MHSKHLSSDYLLWSKTSQLHYLKYIKHYKFKLYTKEMGHVSIFNQSRAIHIVQKYFFNIFY